MYVDSSENLKYTKMERHIHPHNGSLDDKNDGISRDQLNNLSSFVSTWKFLDFLLE